MRKNKSQHQFGQLLIEETGIFSGDSIRIIMSLNFSNTTFSLQQIQPIKTKAT
jgi:hypothetical protein